MALLGVESSASDHADDVVDGGAPAVFLDRDGVICRSIVLSGKPYAARSLKEFKLLPYAAQSVRALSEAGFLVIVITNQPDIGNGLVSQATVDAIHERLSERVAVDQIIVCPHGQKDRCSCRKPATGMLTRAAEMHSINFERSYLVGDRASDIEAGARVGCTTIFIERNYSESGPDAVDASVGSLAEAARLILSGGLDP